MKLGLSSYTYTWAVGVPGFMPEFPLSHIGLIDKTFNASLELLQIADNLPLENLGEEKLDDLLNYARGKNVSIEMAGRGLTPEHTINCLLTAEKLQSPLLRMVIDSPGFEPGLQTVIDTIKDLLPEFESRKIKLAIENHDRFKAREFEKIILSVGSNMVGICLDSVNSMGAGEGFETVSEILIPYTINFHVKDFTIFRISHRMGLIVEGRPAGKGMLKIPELLSELNEIGICQSAILELWTPPEPELNDTVLKESDWADKSIKYMKSILWD
ncbi:MAG: TIM barrel protein [Bacteroidota bacterium]|nr:TIM barrel protein [Bacteroidota bacterium]